MRTPKRLWLLRLVFPGTRGRWLTALVIFVTMLGVYGLFGGLFEDLPSDQRIGTGAALFFCIILSYIIPIHHYIIERALVALEQLAPTLGCSSEELTRWRRRIVHKSRRWILLALALGGAAGVAHNLVLLWQGQVEFAAPVLVQTNFVTTLAVWIVMTTVISSLIDTALLFRDLARRVPIHLLNPEALTPLGSVAVSSTLALIGAQAAFPALMLEGDLNYVTFAPGIIATGVPMICLFLLPVWPVHRRIAGAKRSELERLNREINTVSVAADSDSATPAYSDLVPLLAYRREIAATTEWPFDTSVIGRLALYLIIPPLTWIGAALIEIMIESAI